MFVLRVLIRNPHAAIKVKRSYIAPPTKEEGTIISRFLSYVHYCSVDTATEDQMSRYLAAANAKRLALARSLSSFGVSLHHEDERFRKDEDVDALIAVRMAEVGADMLPPTDSMNLDDELGGLEIAEGEGDALELDDGVGENEGEEDAVSKELERRRRLLLERRRGSDKISHNKANQGGGVTATMKSLNELALKRARAMVVKRFQTPLDLDESSSVAYQIQKQATAAAAQLNGAVQTKLDALKRAADLMDESAL